MKTSELIAWLDGYLTVVAGDFMNRKHAFGLVADVDDHFGTGHFEDAPTDDVPLGEVRHFPVVHVEELVHAKAFQVVCLPPFSERLFTIFRIVTRRHETGYLLEFPAQLPEGASWRKLLILVEMRSLAARLAMSQGITGAGGGHLA